VSALLRPFAPADLSAAHALTSTFGWPHRLEDWAFMARHGQGVVAEQDGMPVGTGLTWLYGADFAALGLVGVQPAQQGKGLGRRLMRALLDGVGDRTVILHATEAGAPLYESLGFVGETLIRQYQGIARGDGLMRLPEGQRLRAIGRADHETVVALDTAATGLARDGLLGELLEMPGGVMLDIDGEAAGFALQRRFGRGQLIGPAVARDAPGAQAMIGHLLGQLAGQFVRVDVPDDGGLGPWLTGFGLADAGPGLRMVRGPKPVSGRDGFFMQAMMSQALG
jgi:GNAT superfamily N-acetyltransferase